MAIVMIAAAMSLTSCEGLPGDSRSQGTVIGGASGAAAGAIIAGEDNRLLGAIIGTVVGAGGGYVIGNELEKQADREAREAAAAKGNKTSSFTVEDVQRSNTADLDADGNVTIAELVALDRAGLSDVEIIRRAEATNVVFDLNEEQKKTLRESGVSATVVDRLATINRKNDPIGTRR